jgi:hypothetical protein
MKLNVEFADWYVKPEMMGHIWAKEMVDLVKKAVGKYGKTTKQKDLINHCFQLNNTDWHYWQLHLSKKFINTFQYVAKRIDKETPLFLLNYVNNRSGCLKNELTWYFEIKAYIDNTEDYFKDIYSPYFMFLGMNEKDCLDRFHRYHQKIIEKYH